MVGTFNIGCLMLRKILRSPENKIQIASIRAIAEKSNIQNLYIFGGFWVNSNLSPANISIFQILAGYAFRHFFCLLPITNSPSYHRLRWLNQFEFLSYGATSTLYRAQGRLLHDISWLLTSN